MKQSDKKRLDVLEQAKQAQPARNRRFAADLLLVYGTPEEQAQWEAAGKPALTRAAFEQALDRVYGE